MAAQGGRQGQPAYLGGEAFTLMSSPAMTPRTGTGVMSWPNSPTGSVASTTEHQGDDELAAVRKECDMLRKQLAIFERDTSRRSSVEAAGGTASFEEYLAETAREEEALRKENEQVSADLADIGAKRAALDAQMAQLERDEQQYWHEHNSYRLQREHLEEERDFSLAYCKTLDAKQEELKSKNVCNDSFYIWHDGSFGTINGFRLGRLPSQPIDWSEINAAWGQVVLLLDIMARYKGFHFNRHRLIPMGSFSRIVEGSNIMELYGSASWFSSFDRAMIAFLQCVREFGDFAEKTDPTLKLPYQIDGDKIGVKGKDDKWFQIKKRFNSEEKWTKALKYMLTNLKWLVAWHCRHDRAKHA